MALWSLEERFWSKVDKHGPFPHKKACEVHPEIKGTRCWLWTGRIRQGYGEFSSNNKVLKAHRVSWMLRKGNIPKGKFVLHKCDMRRCVRHLFLGTQAVNMLDCKKKKRNSCGIIHGLLTQAARPKTRGELSSSSKMSNKDAVVIRKIYAKGTVSHADLAKQYGVSRTSIYQILNNMTYT